MLMHLADVALLAVWVPHTLWAAASDGVRLGDEAGLAGADRVTCNMVREDDIYCLLSVYLFTLWVDVADGAWAAGVWHTRVLGWGRGQGRPYTQVTGPATQSEYITVPAYFSI